MTAQRVLLMICGHDDGPHGGSFWTAASLDGERALTLEQAEALALSLGDQRTFLLPFTDQTAEFAQAGSMSFAVMPGTTIWHYGEPTRAASLRVLDKLANGAESPEPFRVLIPVSAVVDEAISRFGEYDRHDIEAHFDALVLDLEGTRTGEPPAYKIDSARVVVA